jgi:4-carboxymuconolactone decarboxylase
MEAKMTTRGKLRHDGTELRRRLFGPGASEHFVPNYADLRAELAFGAVWNRPGLALEDRMIASLAALCSVQRLNHLRRHIAAALDMGLTPRTIVEIFIQCGIYCGLPASEDAMAVADALYAERGITLPPGPPRDDTIEELEQRGRALMESFHGERAYAGYAAPGNPVTQALYPVAIQYGYGEIWDRPGLDRRQRVIITVAAFTALKLEGQVRKFGQSALSAGLSKTGDHRDGDPDRPL